MANSKPPALAILGYEGGIGVRSGCFCAQQYVSLLLGLEPSERAGWQGGRGGADRFARPGMVRVSLGLYNTREEIDSLVAMLQRIADGDRGADTPRGRDRCLRACRVPRRNPQLLLNALLVSLVTSVVRFLTSGFYCRL